MKTAFRNLSFGGKIFFIIFVVFFGTLIGILFSLFFIKITGESAQGLYSLRWSLGFSSLLTFLFPALVSTYFLYGFDDKNHFSFKVLSIKQYLLTMTLIVVCLPFVDMLNSINKDMNLPASMSEIEVIFRQMEDAALATTTLILSDYSFVGIFINLVLIAVLPAVSEEFFFRGLLMRVFLDKIVNKHIVVWVVAAIFSFIHFQMYGFLPRLFLGAILGYLFLFGRSIWLPIFAHFLNNAIAACTTMWANKTNNADLIDLNAPAWLSLLSLLFLSVLMFLIYKSKKEEVLF